MNWSIANIDIIPFNEENAVYFTRFNTAWLEKYFVVERVDREMLANPKHFFIDQGGFIFFAKINDVIAGTFALLKETDNTYELSKMAVEENYRGMKIGNQMLGFCIRKAKELNIHNIILYSSTQLKTAIHLYKKYGFKEVPLGSTIYKRSDIKMELIIE